MRLLLVGLEKSRTKTAPGGVDFRNILVAREFERKGWCVEDAQQSQVEKNHPDTIVFVQTQGFLSKEFKSLSDDWLSKGWRVVEHNIFGLASEFRPVHENYVTFVSSRDTAKRYWFRNLVRTGQTFSPVIVVPHPLRWSFPTLPKRTATGQYRFLRVGRPDRTKWTTFEIAYVKQLALARPNDSFELTLIGFPLPVPAARPKNLRIRVLPYSTDIHGEMESHSHYLHHSRIGETFGNVFLEALSSGLRVISSVDILKDCGQTDILNPTNAVLGSPRGLIRAAEASFSKSLALPPVKPGAPTLDHYVQQIMDGRTTSTEAPAKELATHLEGLREILAYGSAPPPWIAMGREFLNTARRWNYQDPNPFQRETSIAR